VWLFPPDAVKSTESKKHQEPLSVEIGIILRDERAARGMTLQKFGEFLGVSRQEVRFLEFATHVMNLFTLGRIANSLGTNPSALLALAERRMRSRGRV
jgi:transcriptional regulator with XRE-family HTH domain